MKITYIFRTQSFQRSIERVFAPIIDAMKQDGHDVEVMYVQPYKSILLTLWKNMRYFAKISKHRICHITGDVQYLACVMNPDTTIMTIHDLVPLHRESVPWYSKFLCYWLWYYIPLRRLKVVTCISEATRQDILTFFPWAQNKLVVVPNPVDLAFKYVPKEFNKDLPRILHVGTKQNKNLIRVIEAISDIKCHLRIIGRIPNLELEFLSKYKIDYSNEEFVTDEQIVQEYIDCDIVSFPSLFEGFGMPIIEGQSIGRVILTSNIEPMSSIASEAAMLVDPQSVMSIKEGIRSIIQNDALREKFIEKGIENIQKYDPRNVLTLYNEQYQRLLNL